MIDYRYWVAAPVLPGGWLLLGETSKFAPVARMRVASMAFGAGWLFVCCLDAWYFQPADAWQACVLRLRVTLQFGSIEFCRCCSSLAGLLMRLF